MAVGEKRKEGVISQVSWTDGTAQDVYYGLEHSFQYASNINTDDEMHGIKLSQYATFERGFCPKCQLVSCGSNGVMALRVDDGLIKPVLFDHSNFGTGIQKGQSAPDTTIDVCPGTVFQDYFWYGASNEGAAGLLFISNTGAGTQHFMSPRDHTDSTDEAISNSADAIEDSFDGPISAILNYNNTRLIVATNSSTRPGIWVYYPELDQKESGTNRGKTGWKKVLEYEAGVTIVALTCTFEYLKVRAVDEGRNTKVYYYQGNNNLRSTFVYNVVDLTGVRVTRVYSINGTDYYVSSVDGTDGYVNLYKMVGNTPVQLFRQRAGLDVLDINYKAPYFVGPCSIGAAYTNGRFYIADSYGLFQFTYNPQGYDKGYMKWGLYDKKQVYGVCFNQGFLYVSTEEGCYEMRAYDTGKDGYQEEGILISREYEGNEGGTITKMLDEVRLNYELNPDTDDTGSIDIYVSPNNLWRGTDPETDEGWYKVMHIDNTNGETRTERTNLFNNLDGGESAFKFDWQTITYAIVIKQEEGTHATPIVRQIDLRYHTKDKTNNVYNIKNPSS